MRRAVPAMSGSHERPDDTGCTVIHVDMDAFYVAVAIRDRPTCRTVP